ncbi:hypothetical protein, variant 2 [Phytophthora nicotianae]|uniref:Uncharacterized protein n=1 Tax=Phytophthora nicotianae TaxID=4792 RepID=W2MEU0_PHYNI|nr:hypothetical protein L914_18116 [Phytophthora nicotianae]ETM34871.1 hypothetical protein, variant 1 [Phytophthora nicotianae]ETM34872.1 hypothetical protein, variant 2 [Phytophthora nicotianae]
MLSMVNSSQSVGNNAGSNTSSSTNTSVSMNTGTSVAHAIASLAHSGNTNSQYNPLTLQLQQPQDSANQTRHHHVSNATNNAAAVLTSVSRVGMPAAVATAPKKRSTKSKCSPGLRSGKWTPEEEAFTNTIIHYFKRGLLDVEDGTSLRWYLAKRLNCEAMRVTKKLKGDSSIGKQIFRAVENTPASRQAIRHAREELAVMEARFLESLSGSGVGPGTQHIPSASLPSSLAVSVRGRKILPNMKNSDGQPLTLAPMPQPKSEDARLLMHFFCEAHDGSEEEPEDEKKVEKKVEKKAESGSLSIDLSGKLGKKRPLSSVTNVEKAETSKDIKLPEKKDVASPQTKKQAIEVVNPTVE